MTPTNHSLDDLRIDRTHVPRRSQKVGWIVAALVIAIGIVGFIGWMNGSPPLEVKAIEVALPASGGEAQAQTLLNASGYVTARREATVSSKVTGKVAEVLVEEGARVEEGQILARLDSSNVKKNLQLAEARLESSRKAMIETQVTLEQAKREWGRVSRLAAEGIGSVSELDRAEADVKIAEARLERQQADVTVAEQEVMLRRQELEDTVIRAPFAGVVTSKNAQPGEMISPMSSGGFTRTGICTIVDMDSLEIEVDVSESYINRVKPEQPVEATLDAYPDWRIPAKVTAIIPTADRQKATVKVRVGFDTLDPRILPEMSVRVAFKNGESTDSARANPTIPPSALYRSGGREIVWVLRDGRVERRAVTVRAETDTQVVIAAGLTPGERVVLDAPEGLADGDRVTETNQ